MFLIEVAHKRKNQERLARIRCILIYQNNGHLFGVRYQSSGL